MYYYSTVTNKISNVIIFANHIFSAYILHKAKIQYYFIVLLLGGNKQNYYSQFKDINF